MGTGKRKLALAGAVALVVEMAAPAALAQDFFSALFGAFGVQRALPQAHRYGGSQAYCVRTCDGRYFPITGTGNQSRAASCNSFCPASETKVVYGGNIDNAVTDDGKPYSELPNAFRYREELVAGCTCNGEDMVGLAKVKIEDDPTLRRGDIVAGQDGLMVAGRGPDRRGVSLRFSPAPDSIRLHYQRAPVVARQ